MYVQGAAGQQLLVEDLGEQVKDYIVLVELSHLPFSFIFEIQQSVQVILIVSFVSSGMESKREWITRGFKKGGILVFFPHSFAEFCQRAQQNLFFACLTEDCNIPCSLYLLQPSFRYSLIVKYEIWIFKVRDFQASVFRIGEHFEKSKLMISRYVSSFSSFMTILVLVEK